MESINKAVIMAAGFGSRMRPLTETTPKPLIKVGEKAMIETILDGLSSKGITEIYIVVGHLKEAFQILKEKYPNINIIENPYYDTCNNISSLYVARKHLSQAFIIDGDQIIQEAAFDLKVEKSGYACQWQEGETKEWILKVEDGIVVDCSTKGGREGWQLFSLSRWNKADGALLGQLVEEAFAKEENRGKYWDEIPLVDYKEKFRLGIYQIEPGQIIEIDSLDELEEVRATMEVKRN